jgi:hypothetical protein
MVQSRARRLSTVSAEAGSPISSDRLDDTRRGDDFTDAGVFGIGDENVPGAIYKYAKGEIQFCTGSQSTVSTEASSPVPSDGFDISGCGNDFPNAFVVGIGDENVPCGVHKQSVGIVQFRIDGWPAVSQTTGSISDDRRNFACSGEHFADARVVGVGNEDVPGGVDRHA